MAERMERRRKEGGEGDKENGWMGTCWGGG